jgi:chromatin remodeling complex protein RSC6
MAVSGICTLYLLTGTAVLPIPHLTRDDAITKFWEYNHHQEYPDVAMEAVYCDKKMILILNNSNIDVMPGAKQEIPPGTEPLPAQ